MLWREPLQSPQLYCLCLAQHLKFQSFLEEHVEYYVLHGNLLDINLFHKWIDLDINHFFKVFWEIWESAYRSIVSFVCRITYFENWCNISIFQNIRKFTTFYTIIENVCEYLRVNMNRIDYYLHWHVFECTGFVFW